MQKLESLQEKVPEGKDCQEEIKRENNQPIFLIVLIHLSRQDDSEFLINLILIVLNQMIPLRKSLKLI